MGEMLREALLGIAGWSVALMVMVAFGWLFMRNNRRLWFLQQEMSAALAYAIGLKNPPRGMFFMSLYADGAIDLVEHFPDWPDFFDAYLIEVSL